MHSIYYKTESKNLRPSGILHLTGTASPSFLILLLWSLFWAAYLIFIGVMLSFAFEDIFPSMEPYHIMNQGLIYLLILDFLLRFMLQPAMSQEIKPYLLMPVKKE